MSKLIQKIANIISLIFVFLYLPVHFMFEYGSGQKGFFSSKQGSDTEFSQGCLNRHFPGIKKELKRVYCTRHTWIDTSVRMRFNVSYVGALAALLHGYTAVKSPEQIVVNCDAPNWWNMRASEEE